MYNRRHEIITILFLDPTIIMTANKLGIRRRANQRISSHTLNPSGEDDGVGKRERGARGPSLFLQ